MTGQSKVPRDAKLQKDACDTAVHLTSFNNNPCTKCKNYLQVKALNDNTGDENDDTIFLDDITVELYDNTARNLEYQVQSYKNTLQKLLRIEEQVKEEDEDKENKQGIYDCEQKKKEEEEHLQIIEENENKYCNKERSIKRKKKAIHEVEKDKVYKADQNTFLNKCKELDRIKDNQNPVENSICTTNKSTTDS